MSIRPKTVRRLLILLTVTVLVSAAGAGYYQYQQDQRGTRLLQDRAAGMAAYAAGDHVKALDRLKIYVAKPEFQADYDAVFAYAVSRSKVETARGQHLVESAKIFEQLLALRPTDVAAQHALL